MAPDVTTSSYGVAQSGPGAGVVGDDVPALDAGQPVADAVEQLGERGVEDDGLGVGVVEQVEDLVGAVAEVRVDRHERAP